MVQKSFSRLLILSSALVSSAFANHQFEVGAGLGSVYGMFNLNRVEAINPTIISHADAAQTSFAGGFSVGYSYHHCSNWVVGLEGGYIFSDLTRNINAFKVTGGDQIPARVQTRGAYDVVAKVGYTFHKNFLLALGAGIEGRSFKVKSIDENSPANNISKTSNQTAFAARLITQYQVHKNVDLGLEWRKAFYQKKTFMAGATTLKFNPRTVDTVLFTVKYKFNGLPFMNNR